MSSLQKDQKERTGAKNVWNKKTALKRLKWLTEMAKISLWKAILALGYIQIVFGNPETTIEVTSSNACEICVCSPGPTLQPKEIVKCKNSKSLIKVFSLPNFVRGIEIINIEFGVVFMRGAIRVRNNFDVLVEKVKSVDFQEKSTTIIDSKGTVSFDIKQVKIEEEIL